MQSALTTVVNMAFAIWNLIAVSVRRGGQVYFPVLFLMTELIYNFCYSGLDCSQIRDRGFWTSVLELNGTRNNERLPRSQSSGSVWKGLLWIVGGHGLDLNLPFTMAFNISGFIQSTMSC